MDAHRQLRLTGFGEFVRQHSSATSPMFWTELADEVERMADRDEDWEHALNERMIGIKTFLEKCRKYGERNNWPTKEESHGVEANG